MLREVSPKDYALDAYNLFDKQKGAIVAGKENAIGAMTIGWGTLGCIWNLPVATAYVRPSRHTYQAVEQEDYFSLCFFGSYTKELIYLGTTTGHKEDKIAGSGLSLAYDLAPYFAEASTVLICRKLYAQPFEKSAFLDRQPIDKFYTKGGDLDNYHTAYAGEIVKVLVR